MSQLIRYLIALFVVLGLNACGDKAPQIEAPTKASQPEDTSFVAVFVCGMQSPQGVKNINILACFSGGRGAADTELELTNGQQYGLYKAWNISQLGNTDADGFKISLSNNFSINAQNSSEHLILGLKIVGAQTGNVYFQKQVGQYGVISIDNL
jgi:hypothetical protein